MYLGLFCHISDERLTTHERRTTLTLIACNVPWPRAVKKITGWKTMQSSAKDAGLSVSEPWGQMRTSGSSNQLLFRKRCKKYWVYRDWGCSAISTIPQRRDGRAHVECTAFAISGDGKNATILLVFSASSHSSLRIMMIGHEVRFLEDTPAVRNEQHSAALPSAALLWQRLRFSSKRAKNILNC